MKFKKLVANLTLVSLLGSTLITSGCVGQDNGAAAGSAGNNNSVKQLSDSSSANDNSDRRVWLNISGHDGIGVDSRMHIYFRNGEDNAEEFVGCDNVDWANVHIQDSVPERSYPPTTKDYPAKWQSVFGGAEMLDPNYKDTNYIDFKSNAKPGNKLNCYFNSDILGTNKLLTKKVTFEVVREATAGENTHNQVTEDTKKDIANAAASGLSLQQMNQMSISDVNMDDYVHQYEQSNDHSKKGSRVLVAKTVAELKEAKLNNLTWLVSALRKIKEGTSEENIDLISKRIQRLFKNNSITSKMLIEGAEKIPYTIKINEIIDKFYIDYTEDSIKNKINISAQDYFENKLGLKQGDGADLFSLPSGNDISELETGVSMYDNSGSIKTKILEKMDSRMYGYANGSDERVRRELPLVQAYKSRLTEEPISSIEPAQASVQTGKPSFLANHWGKMLTGTVGIGIFVTIVALILKNMDISVYGKDHTDIIKSNMGVADGQEAEAWNKTHDVAHHIYANATKDSENSANNAAHAEAKFFFAGNDVSKNVGISMSLIPMSTPHKRLSTDSDEPWVGDTSYHSNYRYDTVAELVFGPTSNAGPQQTIDYQMARVQAQEKGIAALAVDDRLDPPQVNLDKVVNSKTDQVLYANGMNGSVFAPGKLGMSVDGFDGVFLNPGEDVKLNVRIPAPSSNGDEVIGGAYAIDFNSTDESAIIPFPVQSKSLKAEYDGKNSNDDKHVTPTYFYSHIDCDYMSAAGKDCPLTLAVGGMDNERHNGVLTISNQASRPTEIPVHMNYRLLEKPAAVSVIPDSRRPADRQFSLTLGNASSEKYQSIEISGLPEGLKEVSNSCSNGIEPGKSCQVSYDAGDISPEETGNSYELQIQGKTAKQNSRQGVVRLAKTALKGEFNPNGADNATVRLSIAE